MQIAYFSMEIGLSAKIPTYSGGLGVLAGDTIKAAADLGLPMCGVTLLHRKGYFRQELNERGVQVEHAVEWDPGSELEELAIEPEATVGGRRVHLRVWQRRVEGSTGRHVPVYFLDADVEGNDPGDRTLTDSLYGGGATYRLSQEILLGMGGVAVLRALGYRDLSVFHMNEGHSALLTVALAEEDAEGAHPLPSGRRDCVFTTHTPVPAGHDRFPIGLVRELLGAQRAELLQASGVVQGDELNMTTLAMHSSRYVNGVALRHSEVSRAMFPGRDIRAITNGVHAITWSAPSFQQLFDRRIADWRCDPQQLRHAVGLPLPEIDRAHAESKRCLLATVEARTGQLFRPDTLTLGFARRATAYKRAELLFSDPDRLVALARRFGGIQIVMAGKAHPRDDKGKAIIRRLFESRAKLDGRVSVVYLEGYDMDLGRQMCSGVDVWLNTPERPLEASGTSGMKAALNGVPSLSVVDGWWVEGAVEGVTGWSIGEEGNSGNDPRVDSRSLYDKLERSIMPTFYENPHEYTRIRRSCIALNASFFNTQRMVLQYLRDAYQIALVSGQG